MQSATFNTVFGETTHKTYTVYDHKNIMKLFQCHAIHVKIVELHGASDKAWTMEADYIALGCTLTFQEVLPAVDTGRNPSYAY